MILCEEKAHCNIECCFNAIKKLRKHPFHKSENLILNLDNLEK